MRSFQKTESAAPAVAEAPVVEQPQNQTTDIAVRSSSGYVEGSIDKSDIKTPFVSCVQSVGPKSVLFTPGTLVLGETQIAAAPAPQQPTAKLRVLFARVTKTYVENLPYNPTPGGPRARIFNTPDAVRAIGGTTEWRGNVAPTFLSKVTCLALVRSPAALDDGQFSVIDGEHTYAPAFVSFQKTSYSAAKTLLTDLSLSLKGNPTGTFYDLFWSREQRGQNWVWVAKLVRARDEKPSDSLTALAIKLSGGEVSIDADEQ